MRLNPEQNTIRNSKEGDLVLDTYDTVALDKAFPFRNPTKNVNTLPKPITTAILYETQLLKCCL